MAILLSVLPRFTTSDYPFGILWPLYCLSFLDLRLLITPFVSFGHCIVFPSSIYDFWLPLWYLVAVVLSVLPRFTTSDYPFGILWPLYFRPSSIYDFWLPLWYLVAIVFSVILRFCIVCHSSIFDFWLPLWYLLAIVLSVLPRYTIYDYPFGILWPLYCLFVLDLRLLITPLVSCGRCIVCPSSINEFWLPLWYLVAIVFSFVPRFTTSDYPSGIFWPLCCLYFLDLRLMIILLVSCGHCNVCPSSIYDFWLLLWYLVAILLSVLPRVTTSDYPFGFLWPFYCLSFLDLRLLITLLVSCGHCIVCPSSIYDFWLPLLYLVAIVLSFPPRFTTSDYPFGILWPLYCLSFLDLRLLITPLVSYGHCIFVLPRFTISNYPFGILWPLYCLSFLHLQLLITPLVTCSHCIVCPFSIYDFWLPLWYLVAIVLSVLPRFCIVCPSSIYDFWLPLWYLVAIVFSVILRFCIVCHSSIYDFWLPFWYLVAIVLSFPPRFTTSDYPFGILWPLYFLSFLDLRLLISPLVSCDHCIVCHSSILYCLSFLDLRLLITLLVSFGHCVVCTSSIYDFWLPLWYLVAVILSVLPRFTTSDYPFGILWPLYFRPSSIYDF